MLIVENGATFDLLGDPHLGRQFINGVPLNRRGEREAMVWRDFTQSLFNTTADFHVNMGDLFDKWTVPYDIIVNASNAYLDAAEQNQNTTYVILKGNHDWIKDVERYSAFDVFQAIVKDVDNIRVIDQPTSISRFLFYPYHPSNDSLEQVSTWKGIDAAFGHWDVSFGDHNMIPTKANIPTFYTGHDHKKRHFVRDGSNVFVVGSMQPYAHGEESDDSLYVTMDKPEGDLHNKVVRLTIPPDGPVDALQLTVQQKRSEKNEMPSVSMGDFSMDTIFKQAFEEANVSPDIQNKLLEQYHTKRVNNA